MTIIRISMLRDRARLNFVPAALSLLIARPEAYGQSRAVFLPLGDLNGGDVRSIARGISDDGSIIVGHSSNAAGSSAPFRWTLATGMIALNPPEGWPAADCLAIAGDGATILGTGVNSPDPENHLAAVLWNAALDPVSFDRWLEPYSMFTGATRDGGLIIGADRVGGGFDPGFSSSFALVYSTAAGLTYLPDLPGSLGFFDNCGAADISADGAVIVGFGETSFSVDAVRWTFAQGQWQVQSLGQLPGGFAFSQARAVTSDGCCIAGFAATPLGYEPFLWSGARGGTMTSLGAPPHEGYEAGAASAISADGTIIVGTWSWGLFPSLEGDGIAFMWTAHGGMRDLVDVLADDYELVLTGWTLTAATGITPDGRFIIGNGVNPQGHTEAWRIDLAPPVQIPGDATGDGLVNVNDLLVVINAWGACPAPPTSCTADVTGDGEVNVSDLLMIINHWS